MTDIGTRNMALIVALCALGVIVPLIILKMLLLFCDGLASAISRRVPDSWLIPRITVWEKMLFFILLFSSALLGGRPGSRGGIAAKYISSGPRFHCFGAEWTIISLAAILILVGWIVLPFRFYMIYLIREKRKKAILSQASE